MGDILRRKDKYSVISKGVHEGGETRVEFNKGVTELYRSASQTGWYLQRKKKTKPRSRPVSNPIPYLRIKPFARVLR